MGDKHKASQKDLHNCPTLQRVNLFGLDVGKAQVPWFSSPLIKPNCQSSSCPLLTIALCPEGKGPIVRDHFKLLVPNGSHAGDAGHRDKTLRIGILGKRGLYCRGYPQKPSPSLTPSTSAEMKAVALSLPGGQGQPRAG